MTARRASGPTADEDSARFWEAVVTHRVVLQRCTACQYVRFPPMPGCPSCGAAGSLDVEASGLGRVYSWIRVHRPIGTMTEEDVPRTVVTIELDEGCRMVGRLIGASRPAMGDPVSVVFLDHVDWTEVAFAASASEAPA